MKDREKQILNFMQKLEISREDAEQLLEDDESEKVLPSVAEMESKAKELKRHYEKGEPKKRKATPKERTVDEEKKVMIDALVETLKALDVTNIKVQTETEINFFQGETSFTLKLTRHRKKK